MVMQNSRGALTRDEHQHVGPATVVPARQPNFIVPDLKIPVTDTDMGEVITQSQDAAIYHRTRRPTIIIQCIQAVMTGLTQQSLLLLTRPTFIEIINYGDPLVPGAAADLVVTFNGKAPNAAYTRQATTQLQFQNNGQLLVPVGAARTYNGTYMKKYNVGAVGGLSFSSGTNTNTGQVQQYFAIFIKQVAAEPQYDINLGFQSEPSIATY